MSKVLVTGANGFIGSHLVELLVSEGYDVVALCEYNSFSSYGWLDKSPYASSAQLLLGDIRDPYFVHQACKGVDEIVHLAALIAIPYSYVAPNSYISTNITGTLNCLNAARSRDVSHYIQISTSEVYGTAQYVPIDENHPLQAQSPYSASKIGSDALAKSFHSSFELPVTIARPFNTYGPRQSARAVIPTIITQILTGKRFISLGSLTPTRDFNFVTDTCGGLLALLKNRDNVIGETLNIGSGSEISIGDTAKLISELMQVDVEILCEAQRKRPDNSEVERLVCSSHKLHASTGFLPRVSLQEGLKATIEWLKIPTNLEKYRAEIYNV